MENQKFTIQQFGAIIKNKYPSYAGYADEEIGQRMLEKYPEYKNKIAETKPEGGVMGAVKGFGTGLAKGAISTVQGLGQLGLKAVKAVTGKDLGTEETFLPDKNALNPQGTAENVGYYTEKIAEFLAPSSKIAQAEKAVTGAIKGASKIAGLGRVATRAGIEGAVAGGTVAAQEGGFDDNAKVSAIVASLIPVVGSTATKIIGSAGSKIQQSVIKPSLRDVEDGFKIENVAKYNVGGNLNQVLAKTNSQINALGQELKTKLKDSVLPLNLNQVYENTVKRLTKSKAENFGEIGSTKRVIEGLKSEIEEVAGPNGLVDLIEAQAVKRGAGNKGAWMFGNPDPDSKAVEKVYNVFYNELKTAIEKIAEKSGQAGIKEINKKLSDLIPISNAVVRRIPIEQRNNAIGLTDSIGLFSSVFDPKALATLGVTRLSKSGRFANLLTQAAEKLKNPKSSVMKRVTGN